MNKYKVFFQIGNKKMQITVEAKSEKSVNYEICKKIKVDKIVEIMDDSNLDYFRDIFGFK